MKRGAKHYYASRTIFLCLLLILLFVVTGCSSKVIYKTKEVEVLVPVPCVAEIPAKPDWKTKQLNDSSTLNDAANAYMIERRQRIAYEAHLEALVNSCAELRPALGAGDANK